ncbi:uncharacterized protein AKAME5_001146400 [Lates japonicus]|uniref:Uncharacterized protein n=1 Tax=Lates japonicus TaxID=270547 RepID=A0AAD3MTA5_LATJO|nr:uncharacterized protein AKAME5_001146400 [Lates japonicus]
MWAFYGSSLAQQKRTKEGLGPVLAGQRGSAHRTDMKMSGFIRQHRGTRDDDGELDTATFAATLDTAGCLVTDSVWSRAIYDDAVKPCPTEAFKCSDGVGAWQRVIAAYHATNYKQTISWRICL